MRTARVRALLAELIQALDELDAQEPRQRVRKATARPRRVAVLPERMPSQSVIDEVARTMRRKGFVG